jgi:hypothetical protein
MGFDYVLVLAMNFKRTTISAFVSCSISGLFFLLFLSCEYTPNEINFVKKDSTITNQLIIKFDSLTPDTLRIFLPTTFSFDAQVAAGESINMSASVSGPENFNLNYSLQNSTFSVLIDPRGRESGIYTMNITLMSGTGTGTLREKVGAEVLMTSIKKVLLFDNHPIENMEISSIQNEENTVIIHWEMYPYKNLKRITLWRLIENPHGIDKKSFDVSPNMIFYKDLSYVGDMAEYYLETETFSGEKTSGPKYTFIGKASPRVKTFKTLASSTSIEVSWSKFQYPANFINYQLYEFNNSSPLCTITDISDTSYVLTQHIRYGEYYNLYLAIETHGNFSVSDPLATVALGDKMAVTKYEKLFFSNDMHRIYYFKPERLGVIYDNVLTDSINMNYSYTAPFKLMIPHSGTSLFVLNSGLSKYNHVNLSYEKNTFNSYCMTARVTDDLFMIYSIKDEPNCYPDPNRPPGIALYNYSQNISLDTLTTYSNATTAPAILFTELGYDNRTVLVKNEDEFRIAKFDQTHFILDQKIPIPVSFEAHFLPFDNNKIYAFNSTQTIIYSLNTGQSILNNLAETIILPELDQVSGWLGGLNTSNSKYMIFDILTGRKLWEINLSPSPHYYTDYRDPSTLYLWAKKLYLKPGYVLDLK